MTHEVNIMEEHFVFFDEIKTAQNVYRVTLPAKLVEGAGWKVGDKVKIWIRRVTDDE
jgi:bifunctional DNA-binding transcriptional regulator/antitoxin component of YhaV-PrlF toxin-antitoxin module